MRVLGLDLSLTSSGIALIDPPASPLGMVCKPGKVVGAERLARIGDSIREVWQIHLPDLVAIEGYSYGSESLAHALGELGGVVRYLLHRDDIRYVVLPVPQWRRQLFGRNIRKDEVSKEAMKRYGVEFESLDTLEAWCVATAALRLEQGLDKPPAIRPKRKPRPGGLRVRSVAT